jgi:hypothetical protein
MYPQNYFNLFPPFPRNNTVFVAMSFDSKLNHRWENVIQPAISTVSHDGNPLEAKCVDTRRIGDSILTEILTHIRNARLIFADVSLIGQIAKRPVRNGNVMYEVGIAHAVRLPEEVLLFRSDNKPLLFDVANVRVNHYEPDKDTTTACSLVIDAINEALREVELKKHLAVQATAHALDSVTWWTLATVLHPEGITRRPI